MAKPSVSTSSAARVNRGRLPFNQDNWSRLTIGVTLFAVAAITGITAAVSYDHEYNLSHLNGQPGWVSACNPFTVDGLILGSSVVLFWAASKGIQGFLQLWRPVSVLVVGILATIAANLAAGIVAAWLRPAVSAWPGISLILLSDVFFWLIGKLRSLADGEDLQPVVACKCPKPATALTDALLLARGELRRLGKPSGEQVLADSFGVTRHQVRTALVPPGDTPQADTRAAATASLNGHSADTAQA
jgi:Protein of unknown function (DUF2637)